jgi:hypothetical protein
MSDEHISPTEGTYVVVMRDGWWLESLNGPQQYDHNWTQTQDILRARLWTYSKARELAAIRRGYRIEHIREAWERWYRWHGPDALANTAMGWMLQVWAPMMLDRKGDRAAASYAADDQSNQQGTRLSQSRSQEANPAQSAETG